MGVFRGRNDANNARKVHEQGVTVIVMDSMESQGNNDDDFGP